MNRKRKVYRKKEISRDREIERKKRREREKKRNYDSERHDLKSQLWLFFSPFLFPLKKRGKKKRRMNNQSCDFKSYLCGTSIM